MGDISFYLKKAEPGTDKSLIILQWKYQGRKLVFSTKHSIESKNWNKEKQRVKSNKITTSDGQYSLNDLLDNLQKVAQKAYNDEVKNGIPEPSTLKRHLLNFLNQNNQSKDVPTLYKLIERFISGEIKNKGKDKKEATIKKYKTIKKHLQDFEKEKKYPINYHTITLDFFYKYVTYLKEKGLKQNSIAKDISILKVFMNEAVDLEETSNVQFRQKKLNVSAEDVDAVYLTEKEIIKLYKHDLSDNKKLEQQRDLFVVGCFTGLRYIDYSTIKPENIVTLDGELFIKKVTVKTNELVVIPCHHIVLEIFDKYAENANRLPNAISNQKFNDYIKDAAREAGLKEKGRLIDEPDKPLWECISSHTARRSFATNLYLDGFPTIDIMKVTGHKTEKSFMKYIKISKLDAAKRLSEHNKKMWSMKLLKVA